MFLRVFRPSPISKSLQIKIRIHNMIFSHYSQESWNVTTWRLEDINFQVSPRTPPLDPPTVSSLAWLGKTFFWKKFFSQPQILPAGSLMNVTFILLSSSLVLRICICIYANLPVNAIDWLPHPRSGDSQGHETFSASSADKQIRNHDTECSNHHPSLSTLRPKDWVERNTKVKKI